MTIQELEEVLGDLCQDNLYRIGVHGEVNEVVTFEEDGVLTEDRGLVLRLGTDEFQVTIVRTKGTTEEYE